MPPFVLPERTVTLVFEDGPLLGLELEVRIDIPLDTYFELQKLVAAAIDKKTGLEGVRTLHRRFVEIALVGWNLAEPPTPEAFTGKVGSKSAQIMVNRYIAAAGGKLGPLAPGSASGPTSKVRRGSKRRSS